MGWSTDVFVDAAVPGAVVCHICLDVLDDPVDANCEEQHVFCRSCLDEWFDARPAGAACPTCNEPVRRDRVRPAKSIRRLVLDLKASCPNRDAGCKWAEALSGRADHAAQCPLTVKQCRGCGADLRQKDLQAHEAGCDRVRRPCANADIGCPDEITDPEREEHLATCRQRCRQRLEDARAAAQAEKERAGAEKRRADRAEQDARDHLVDLSAQRRDFQLRALSAEQRERQALTRAEAAEAQAAEHLKLLQAQCFTAVDADSLAPSCFVARCPLRGGTFNEPNGVWGIKTELRQNSSLSVFLVYRRQTKSLKARFSITLLNSDLTKSLQLSTFDSQPTKFSSSHNSLGWSEFADLRHVSDPAEGFVRNGQLFFQVTIKAELKKD